MIVPQPAQSSRMQTSGALRLVAAVELLKGLLVLLAASGLLALIHRDVHDLAALLVKHTHLNPASKYPKILLDASAQVSDARLWQLAAGAVTYSVVRVVEAYGLYRQRAWAEVLAAVSGAVYVPFEVMELIEHPTLLSQGLLALNLAVVALMVRALHARRRMGAA
jgi:uncharacterized membrane protein (DUF2068 family)